MVLGTRGTLRHREGGRAGGTLRHREGGTAGEQTELAMGESCWVWVYALPRGSRPQSPVPGQRVWLQERAPTFVLQAVGRGNGPAKSSDTQPSVPRAMRLLPVHVAGSLPTPTLSQPWPWKTCVPVSDSRGRMRPIRGAVRGGTCPSSPWLGSMSQQDRPLLRVCSPVQVRAQWVAAHETWEADIYFSNCTSFCTFCTLYYGHIIYCEVLF